MGLKTSEHSGKKQAPLSRRNDEESENMNEGERGGMIKTLKPKNKQSWKKHQYCSSGARSGVLLCITNSDDRA